MTWNHLSCVARQGPRSLSAGTASCLGTEGKARPPPRRRVACHGLFRSPFHFAVRSGAGSVSITGRTGWCWAWWPPAHEVRRPLPSPAPPAPGSRDSAHPAFSLLAAPPVWPVNSREGRATALEPHLLSVFLARVSTSLGAGPTHTGESSGGASGPSEERGAERQRTPPDTGRGVWPSLLPPAHGSGNVGADRRHPKPTWAPDFVTEPTNFLIFKTISGPIGIERASTAPSEHGGLGPPRAPHVPTQIPRDPSRWTGPAPATARLTPDTWVTWDPPTTTTRQTRL